MLTAFRLQFSRLPAEAKERLKQLNQRILLGSIAQDRHNTLAACKFWLEGWGLVKALATEKTGSLALFQQAYRGLLVKGYPEFLFQLAGELQNAGLKDRASCETCIRYVHELLEVFPLERDDPSTLVYFCRAEGEALWELGRVAESEAVYAALVERLPDEGWAYIGWADQYWMWSDTPKKYERGESILKQALKRPALNDKADVLERLMNLYDEWGKESKADEVAKQLEAL